MRRFVVIFFVCVSLKLVAGKSAEEWKSRVIYQVLTDRFARTDGSGTNCNDIRNYCGGTFAGIKNKLDYIQGLGANAIWISPVVNQTDGGYHGYWASNISTINPHFGNVSDLKDLVDACHQRDIWVMLDIVANHMGYAPGCPSCPMDQKLNFNGFYPFNKAEHYHNYCTIENWADQNQVENCRLADLPDLNQQNNYVRQTLLDWIKNIVQTYHFDGIRIDTVPEVPKDFWTEFGQAAGVFQLGEVDNGDPNYVGPYQGPLAAVLNYPFYFTLRDVFQSKQSMAQISERYQQEQGKFKDLSVLGGFIDNHDNPRFLSGNQDWTALKNALAFNIMSQWIPIIYYGTEQAFSGGNDPDNRAPLWPHYDTTHELYKFISTTAKFRNSLGDEFFASEQKEKWADNDVYAFSRGPNETVLVVLTKDGSGTNLQRTIPDFPYSDGTVLTNVLDPTDKITASGGKVMVAINNGQPKIYYSGNVEASTFILTTPVTSTISNNYTTTVPSNATSIPQGKPVPGGALAAIMLACIAISAAITAGIIIIILKKTKLRYEPV